MSWQTTTFGLEYRAAPLMMRKAPRRGSAAPIMGFNGDQIGWSFNPSEFGFVVSRRFDQLFLSKKQPTKFYWIAEKAVRFRDVPQSGSYTDIHVTQQFQIRKRRGIHEYEIRRETWRDDGDPHHNPRKIERGSLYEISNKEEAEAVLKFLGALRKSEE